MIVIKIAITPSMNASSLPLVIGCALRAQCSVWWRAMAEFRSPARAASLRLKLLLLAFGLLVSVAFGELAARVWVAWRWPDDKLLVQTRATPIKGRYMQHAVLPYVLNPRREYGHNRLGFRGEELTPAKPAGRLRIACLGASTTYGIYVEPNKTYAAQLQARLRKAGYDVDVINAGVPGWVSTEIRSWFELAVAPLKPDLVIYYEGRNELFPEGYRGFRPDYRHFRDAHYDFVHTNARIKRLHRASYLAMLVLGRAPWLLPESLRWSERSENALYGSILERNAPISSAELVALLGNPRNTDTFRASLAALAEDCRRSGCRLALSTMAFIPQRLATGNLPGDVARDPAAQRALGTQLTRNNDVMRELAQSLRLPLFETAALAQHADDFRDDCHRNAQGHARHAELLFTEIERLHLLDSTLAAHLARFVTRSCQRLLRRTRSSSLGLR